MSKTHARGKTESSEILRQDPYSVITTQCESVHGITCLHFVNTLSRPYHTQTPELLSQVGGNFVASFLSLTYFHFQDSWAIEKQFIAERRLQLHQQLNEDIQKLGDQYFTDTTKLDQKETVLDESLRATLRYSSRLLEDIPLSPSTTSPYIHLSAPSPAIYENVPWSWPPLMDQRTLGVMTDDQTPFFQSSSTIIHECGTLHQPSITYYNHSVHLSPCCGSA